MRRAFGYISLKHGEEGSSVIRQRADILNYVFCHSLPLLVEFHEGVLPSLGRTLPEVFEKAIDHVLSSNGVLIVQSLTRFARSTDELVTVAQRLRTGNGAIVALDEFVDTTDSPDNAFYGILGVVAALEQGWNRKKRIALALKRGRAERVSGRIPYGYSLAEDGRNLIRNPSEQDGLRIIHDLRRNGLGYQKIADELNSKCIATKNGGRWKPSSIKSVLSRLKTEIAMSGEQRSLDALNWNEIDKLIDVRRPSVNDA